MKTVLLAFLLCLTFCCLVSAQSETFVCPNINVSSNSKFPTKPNETIIFTANAPNFNERADTKYEWTVEGGKLIAGQGR